MPDFREQIQKHYEAQALPAAQVDAILAEARAAAGSGEKVVPLPGRRAPFRRITWAIAASLVIFAGLATWWSLRSGPTVSYADFAPRVVEFFGVLPELPKRSQNPEELRAWLLAQGAPADFQLPAKLRALQSFGCQVIDVHGRPAYLTCFWSEKPGADPSTLVHLLVARRSDFKDAPPSATPQFREIGDWSFAAWTQGDVIYTLAATTPLEKLKPFVASVSRDAPIGMELAAVRWTR